MPNVASKPLLDAKSEPPQCSTPGRKTGATSNDQDYLSTLVETPKRMREELEVTDHKVKFLKDAFGLDVTKFSNTADMVKSITTEKTSKLPLPSTAVFNLRIRRHNGYRLR
jgi:hypothetical protein